MVLVEQNPTEYANTHSQSEFQAHLKTLHQMTLELSLEESLDVLYRRAVEYAVQQLGLSHIGIFRLNSPDDQWTGTYGVDPQGNIRQMYDYSGGYSRQVRVIWDALSANKGQILLREDVPLIDLGQVVGRGWHVTAALWRGDSIFGLVFVDNLIHQQPPRPYEEELISLYSASIAHLITRKEIEDELRASQQRYQQLFENVPIVLLEEDYSAVKTFIDDLKQQGINDFRSYFLNNPDAVMHCAALIRFLAANHAALNLYDVPSKNDMPQVLAQVMGEEYAYQVLAEELISLAEGSTKYQNETINQTSSGDLIHLSIDLSIAPGAEETWSRILVAIKDITASKHAEKVRLENERLQYTVTKEQELNELKNRLLRMLSHELRTPLAIIDAASTLLNRYENALSSTERQTEFGKISSQVNHLREILDDVSLVIKAETGHLELEPTMLDLTHFCSTLFDEFRTTLDYRYQLIFSSSDRINGVYADPVLLRHILSNLVTNAIKYSPDGGNVYIDLHYESDAVVFTIKDEGIGIPAENQHRLFESYYRAENVGNIGGTGLGLKIVKDTIDLYGGQIEVESRIGQGTTFRVILPIIAM